MKKSWYFLEEKLACWRHFYHFESPDVISIPFFLFDSKFYQPIVRQSINQSVHQSINNQSINRSTTQSINQWNAACNKLSVRPNINQKSNISASAIRSKSFCLCLGYKCVAYVSQMNKKTQNKLTVNRKTNTIYDQHRPQREYVRTRRETFFILKNQRYTWRNEKNKKKIMGFCVTWKKQPISWRTEGCSVDPRDSARGRWDRQSGHFSAGNRWGVLWWGRRGGVPVVGGRTTCSLCSCS